MRISTFFFLTRRGLRNLGKHWAMTIACIASLSVCMTLNSFASLAEVNVDSMVSYLGSQNETVVYLDPDCDDATATQVGEKLSTMPGVSGVQYVSKQDVLNIYRGYMEDYSSLWDEFESDNPFKANYRVTISDLSQMAAMSKKMQAIPGVYSVAAPVEMTNVFVEVQQAVTKGGRLIVLVLMIVSIITVGSTIRLSVFARRGRGPGHGPDLRRPDGGREPCRLLLYRQRSRYPGRPVAADHGPRPGAGGKRLAHRRDLQPGGRRSGGRPGQHVLHPQASECLTERRRP